VDFVPVLKAQDLEMGGLAFMLGWISFISVRIGQAVGIFMIVMLLMCVFRDWAIDDDYGHPGYSPDYCRGCGNGMILTDTRKCELCGTLN